MQIALVGCGTVGCTLGGRLLGAGHPLRVHDRERGHALPLLDAGAAWSEEASEVVEGCGAIVSALPRGEDVEAVFAGDAGVWAAAARHTLHIETSTIGVASARRLAGEAKSAGVRFLDAPISRGAAGESAIPLVAWVGGSADYYDLARPVLEELADRVVFCGGVGQGQATKLLNNLIAHSLTVIVGEALSLGVSAGLSVDLLHSALHEGTAQNRMLDEMLPLSAFRGDWRPGLRLEMAVKDLALAAELAEEHGISLAALDRFRELYDGAVRRGWGELSAHAVVRLIEESSGVTLRSPIFEALRPSPTDDPSD